MSTRLQLRTAVRAEIVEPTPGYWTDDELNGFLNKANRDATALARIVKEAAPWNTVSGTAAYAMPADFLEVRRLKVGDYDLRAGSVDDISGESGSPYLFIPNLSVTPNTLILEPVPDSVLACRLWYVIRATEMTLDTQSPSFHPDWHDICADYTIGRALRKQKDPAYATYLRDWENGCNDMAAQLSGGGTGQPRMVGDGGWSDIF